MYYTTGQSGGKKYRNMQTMFPEYTADIIMRWDKWTTKAQTRKDLAGVPLAMAVRLDASWGNKWSQLDGDLIYGLPFTSVFVSKLEAV
ncbi:unnamed protein product [Strongylus vulgaris]|uniref:Uncharacterized protein n=1 Tax=Strongylus vulgaris TaxID=40348 RepID=A0A3P7JA29_STRVU|nr:unnamed protein product [Strongylus vulgaris]